MLIIYPRKLIVALCVLSCLAFGTLQYDVPNWTHLAKAQAATNENQQQAPETKQALSWTEDEFAAMATGTSVTLDTALPSATIKIIHCDFRFLGHVSSNILAHLTRGAQTYTIKLSDSDLEGANSSNPLFINFKNLDKGIGNFQAKDKISFTLKSTSPFAKDDTFTVTPRPQKDSHNYNTDGYFELNRTNPTSISNPVIHWTFNNSFTITPPTGQPLPGPLTATALGALFYAYMKKRKKA